MERGGSNLSDKGLNSVDRGSKATLPLTIPRRRFKSPAKDSTRRRAHGSFATGFSTKRDDQLCESTVPLASGRADIEGSKATPLMNAWLPQASYPCDVPPSQTPHLTMSSARSTRQASLDLKEGVVTPPPVHGSTLHSELAVRRPRNSRELFPVRPRRHATRRLAASSSSSPPTVDGFELGSSSPALRANPFPGYGSILPTSLPTLFHRPEAVHLGDLMRYEYDRRERTRSSGFSRAAECTDTTRRGGALPAAGPYLR
ncbi:hypothetical protein Bca4012_103817 [Brassica carinata]